MMNSDSIYVDEDEISISLEKLKMYKRDNDLLLEDINNCIHDLICYYQSKNSDKIVEIDGMLRNNFHNESRIYEEDINYISNELVSFGDVVKKVKSSFEKLGDSNAK